LSDITSARWRGFAIGLSYFPFLITPWVSAFIAESVVAENGIGWRWGIGMFAIRESHAPIDAGTTVKEILTLFA
jgi:hypothetical protein